MYLWGSKSHAVILFLCVFISDGALIWGRCQKFVSGLIVPVYHIIPAPPVHSSQMNKFHSIFIDRDRHNSIISRPVDQIIGIVPKVTEEHFNKLSRISQNKRLVGEIAFQLDRRILEHVFGISLGVSSESSPRKKRRYYGFSVTNMGHMIRKVATNKNGEFDAKLELELRYRFDYVIRRLMKIGYNLDLHGEFSQDMVNKYGLMSGPPDQETAKEYGLDDPILLRILLSQLIENETELFNLLVLLDGLFLLSHDDKNPLYMW